MDYVNRAFEWVCIHEKDILLEFAFATSKEKLLKEIIQKKFPDKKPETIQDVLAIIYAGYKYTESYDKYLEKIVEKLIVDLGGTV